METSHGAELHNPDEEARKQAARMLGSIRTERKAESSRQNAAKRRGVPLSEEHRAKLKEAQRLRREREQATGVAVQNTEKKPVGRPRKTQPEQTTETAPQQKRGRGRPRKAEQATLPIDGAETGA